MGQYFKAINNDKREYVCPWCIGGGAKLWEWAVNSYGAIFTLLLRKSDESGGGDVGTRTVCVELDDTSQFPAIIAEAVAREGAKFVCPVESVVGRWAGDRIMLIGDYDSSELWEEARQYRNISRELVAEWNVFVQLDDKQLTFEECGSCARQRDY